MEGAGSCAEVNLMADDIVNLTVYRRHGPVARDQAYDLLAEHTARHIDVNGILDLIGKSIHGS